MEFVAKDVQCGHFLAGDFDAGDRGFYRVGSGRSGRLLRLSRDEFNDGAIVGERSSGKSC